MSEELLRNIEKVIEGFDKEMFIRNVSFDPGPGWAIKLLPYLAALLSLRVAVSEQRSTQSQSTEDEGKR